MHLIRIMLPQWFSNFSLDFDNFCRFFNVIPFWLKNSGPKKNYSSLSLFASLATQDPPPGWYNRGVKKNSARNPNLTFKYLSTICLAWKPYFFVTSQGKIGPNSMLLQYLCTYWIKIIIIYLFTNKCIKIAIFIH